MGRIEVFQRILFRLSILGIVEKHDCFEFIKNDFAFPVPIILAILISECRNEKFKRVIQTASYLPNFVSWVLVYGISTALLSQEKVLLINC